MISRSLLTKVPKFTNLQYSRSFSTNTILKSKADNYYDILSVPHTADKARIKSQFYSLSMKYHPDKNPNDEGAHEKFLKITEAYSVLSDEVRRRDYDRNFISNNSRFNKNSVSNRFRSKPSAHSKPVKQYPSNVKFREGFQQSFKGDKYNNKNHQFEHYDQFTQAPNGATPFRAQGRPIYNDLPKMEGAGDVMGRFFMLGALLLLTSAAASMLLSDDKNNYKAGYKSRNSK
jgi:curved DNA-binding protein CbpA